MLDSFGGNVNVSVEGAVNGRGTATTSVSCRRMAFVQPWVVDTLGGSFEMASSSMWRLTTPSRGSPSRKKLHPPINILPTVVIFVAQILGFKSNLEFWIAFCWKETFIGRSPSLYFSIKAVIIIKKTFYRIFDSSAFFAESARNSRFHAF